MGLVLPGVERLALKREREPSLQGCTRGVLARPTHNARKPAARQSWSVRQALPAAKGLADAVWERG